MKTQKIIISTIALWIFSVLVPKRVFSETTASLSISLVQESNTSSGSSETHASIACLEIFSSNKSYVNVSATGRNNGTSWEDAFTDLQLALDACADTLWVNVVKLRNFVTLEV